MYIAKNSRFKKKRPSWQKPVLSILAVLCLLVGVSGLWVYNTYTNGLKPVDTSSEAAQTVVIESGATLGEIANQLESAGLIRSIWAFQWYAGQHGVRNALQAGTYSFSPSQGTPQIISQLSHGKVATDLVTIIPGQRIDQIRTTLISYGFSERDVDDALNPSRYLTHSIIADKPIGNSLEGLIYPDSYQKSGSTTPQEVITQALNEMQGKLTPDLLEAFHAQGLETYDAIIIASIVEKEVSNPDDRAKVAQVFLKRIRIGMQLGSDVTAFYGAYLVGMEPSVSYDSPYNTRIHGGLPPTPISNVTVSALEAVAHPADTDWLYFVAGDDGTTHFAKTFAEHEANVAKYCTALCGR